MATEIWVNIGSDNGLLPNGTKPLPVPLFTQPSIIKICLKITYLELHSNFPGASELKCRLDIYVSTSVVVVESVKTTSI